MFFTIVGLQLKKFEYNKISSVGFSRNIFHGELRCRGSLVSLQLIVQIGIHSELSFRPGYQREQKTRVLSPAISPKILYYLIILY